MRKLLILLSQILLVNVIFIIIIRSPGQMPCELLPSLGIHRPSINSVTSWPNKAKFYRNIYGRSSLRFFYFIPLGQKTWGILLSSHLKPGGTMNCYFVGMVYGRYIGSSYLWIGQFKKIFSKTIWPN